MDSSFTSQELKVVRTSASSFEYDGLIILLTVIGPILDTWGPTYIILPGSIGMVVSLVCFSFSKGKIPRE